MYTSCSIVHNDNSLPWLFDRDNDENLILWSLDQDNDKSLIIIWSWYW